MTTIWQLIGIALAGGLGSLCRYGIYQVCTLGGTTVFAWGTLLANTLGCFFAGVLIGSGLAESSTPLRVILGIGFLGGLTTFSTFSIETLNLLRHSHWGLALVNVGLNLICGIGMAAIGLLLAKRFFS